MRRSNLFVRYLDSISVNDRQLTAGNLAGSTAVSLASLTSATPTGGVNEFLVVDSDGNYSYQQQLATDLIEVATASPSNSVAANNAAFAGTAASGVTGQLFHDSNGRVYVYTGAAFP